VLDENAFATARPSENAERLPAVDLEVHAPQNQVPPKTLMQVPDFNEDFSISGHWQEG
jgi:hypothetical protein